MTDRAAGVAPAQVMRVLADLAPDATGRDRKPDQLVRLKDMAVLPLGALALFESASDASDHGAVKVSDDVVTLAERAALHADGSPLRAGWLWVFSRTEAGTARFPLVSVPVELVDRGRFGGRGVQPIGDVELTDLITDPDIRQHLETSIEFGGGALHREPGERATPDLLARLDRLIEWAATAAAAAGFPGAALSPGLGRGEAAPSGTFVMAQVHAYLADPPRVSATIATSLQRWAATPLDGTAFTTIYCGDDPGADAVRTGTERAEVVSSIVLTSAQRSAVASARTEPVTVISGPPGTGKSQALAAIALDAVARGESVLVTAPSEAAVDALFALLTAVPGPDPIVFGSIRRYDVATRLGQGGGAVVDEAHLARATQRHDATAAEYRRLHDTIRELLHAEQLATANDPSLTLFARQATPRWFDPTCDLAEAGRLLDRARHVAGLFAGMRAARRLARLQQHAGTALTDLDALAEHLAAARSVRAASELVASGGLDLEPSWSRLIAADEARRTAHAEWLNALAHSSQRIDRTARGTMAAVAAALRSGRGARRQQLARIDGSHLTRALPLWVGTLRDVDDLLPSSPAMFDLVIVDEASQVDQVVAAPALARARRAVVAGDPKQLRHVSFVSDARIRQALDAHAVTDRVTAGRLDVRRLSTFDVAASVAPVRFLDEHFRSRPHLVEFSAERFYDARLAIATRHPANDRLDCITVRHVAGGRDEDGVNRRELDVVMELVEGYRGRGRTVGVVSPFRAHIDVLEREYLGAGDKIRLAREVGLRIGTVHGFQGCERDVLIVTLAVGPDAPAASLRFLTDENLFNVMITRAREEIVVVTSLPADTPGLAGDYLRHADEPPHPPLPRPPGHPLAHTLAADLARSGVHVVTGYPAGRHTLDLVVGDGPAALGVVCGVHPDGPDAHIERRLALTRAGWALRDVFATRWGERHAELAVELALEARRRTDAAAPGQALPPPPVP